MKSSFSQAYVIKCFPNLVSGCYYRMLFTKTVRLGIKTSEIGEDFFRIIASVTYICSLRFNLHCHYCPLSTAKKNVAHQLNLFLSFTDIHVDQHY